MILRISKNRKAISPVLATVILIAITLIAAIAIAGFVFGLFGSFTSSAQVSAQTLVCSNPGGANVTDYCTVRLTNTGTSNTSVTGCSLRIAGVSQTGTRSVQGTSYTVTASSNGIFGCRFGAAAQTVGSQAVGSFSMSNGATVPFSGTWS
jgi:flagellin-like protein